MILRDLNYNCVQIAKVVVTGWGVLHVLAVVELSAWAVPKPHLRPAGSRWSEHGSFCQDHLWHIPQNLSKRSKKLQSLSDGLIPCRSMAKIPWAWSFLCMGPTLGICSQQMCLGNLISQTCLLSRLHLGQLKIHLWYRHTHGMGMRKMALKVWQVFSISLLASLWVIHGRVMPHKIWSLVQQATGWTNPFREMRKSKLDHFPHVSGWTFKKTHWNHHPTYIGYIDLYYWVDEFPWILWLLAPQQIISTSAEPTSAKLLICAAGPGLDQGLEAKPPEWIVTRVITPSQWVICPLGL